MNAGVDPGWLDWLSLFAQFLWLSILSVGGTVAVLPDMHRYLVSERGWITDQQFATSITLAQASPGPNVLFVALLGWNAGANVGSLYHGVAGMLITMVGILLPSCTVTYVVGGWGYRNRERRAVRGFKSGMAPIVIALLIATSWVMASAYDNPREHWPLWLATLASALLMWKTKVHLLWLIGTGALLGYLGVL